MENLKLLQLNKVLLCGRVARDPELRYTTGGKAVLNFLMVSSRPYRNREGEWEEESAFVQVVVWQRLAEICNEYLNKGSAVFVEGRLKSRMWESEQGESRKAVDIVADRVKFLNRAPKAEDGNGFLEEPLVVEEEEPVGS